MSAFLEVGRRLQLGGDVTQLSSVIGKTTSQLEQAIGYEKGRLRDGRNLLFLCDDVGIGEFRWGHTTALSGGRSKDSYEFQGKRYHAEIQDEVRFDIYKKQGFDEARGDRVFEAKMAQERQLLRDRTSPRRIIIKVLPNIRHDSSKPWWVQYPDAAGSSAIRQWKLTKPKWFVVAANVRPGFVYSGGAGGQALLT